MGRPPDSRDAAPPPAPGQPAPPVVRSPYDELLAQAVDAIVVIDPAQRIVLFNRGAEEIFGWSAQEAIGQAIDMLVPERSRERHRAAVDAFAAGPARTRQVGRERQTITGLRKNGEEFPAEADIYKLESAGAPLLAAILRDISARKLQESKQAFLAHIGATLASSLEYEETLSTVARLAVPLLADYCIVELREERGVRRLKVVHVDPGMAPLAAALESVRICEPQVHPIWHSLEEQRSVLLRALTPDYLERMAQSPEHLRMLRALAPVSLISVPLVARDRVLGALSFCSVRPGHAYGEDDLRLAEELARRAALAIDNSQLYALAQNAIRARDEILGVVAHDLRNPLNTIQFTADVILHRLGQESEKLPARVQSIVRASEHAHRLIQDLLEVVRIEGGRLVLERVPCAPGYLLDVALDMMRAAAESTSIELTGASEPALPEVVADRDRILQVFSNLVGNALKFTPAGGRVVLAAARGEHDVCFSVADTGPGIPADHLPHLFDRFWQGRPTDRRGAGLGLAIAKAIIEAHGGRIWAESTLHVGSTFFFTVPALPASESVP